MHLLSLIDSLRTVPHRLYTYIVQLPYTVLPPRIDPALSTIPIPPTTFWLGATIRGEQLLPWLVSHWDNFENILCLSLAKVEKSGPCSALLRYSERRTRCCNLGPRKERAKKKRYTTSRNLRLVVATLYELLPLHFAIQAGISLIFRLQVAGCDVAQAGFLTLTFRLFELV